MNLTQEEVQTLSAKREVANAIHSWQSLFTYLESLVESDSQKFVDTVVKPRLNIDVKQTVELSLQKGTIELHKEESK